jgi:hypothetical protein
MERGGIPCTLHAAAPDMLAALEALREIAQMYHKPVNFQIVADIALQVNSAIRKAKGES